MSLGSHSIEVRAATQHGERIKVFGLNHALGNAELDIDELSEGDSKRRAALFTQQLDENGGLEVAGFVELSDMLFRGRIV